MDSDISGTALLVDDETRNLDPQALVSQAERERLLYAFNDTTAPYPQDALLHQLFMERAQRTPDHIAVVYGHDSLTYGELDIRTNQLARYLRSRGVAADNLVGLCLERSLDLVVGLLGILKSGGAYVPLDPTYPAKRLQYMVDDASLELVLTQQRLQAAIPLEGPECVTLDAQWEQIAAQEGAALDPATLGQSSRDLAYVIYTSGSTGEPKGVMVEHRNVVNHWKSVEPLYRSPFDCRRIAVNAPVTFDGSVKQIVQLFSGCTLFIVPQPARLDAQQLLRFIEKHHIDCIDCTPSQLETWLSAGLLQADRHVPRTVLIGGEAIHPALWQSLSQCPTITFYNVYGPTECTVDTTAASIRQSPDLPNIGRPLQNIRVYLLDSQKKLVPIGQPGEIYVAGAGVARGYLNRPDLTGERFLRDFLGSDPYARLYKTGDLGKWHPDGTLEYLGRNDHQVKIRGFRFELGEIEAHLMRHPRISQAAVVVREDTPGQKYLVAYVVRDSVPSGSAAPDTQELREHLLSRLPDYMVPGAFMVLERMPLTANGKLDRRALPAPDLSAYVTAEYAPPQSDTEALLVEIWQELLRIGRVGRLDHFFELGGHSLLIPRMLDKLRHAGLKLEIQRIYENPTLADLARAVTNLSAGPAAAPSSAIPAGCTYITPQMLDMVRLQPEEIARIISTVPGGAPNVQDIYPLAPLQEGIFFHHLLTAQGGDTYVLLLLMSFSSQQRLHGFVTALQQVIDRHDNLRTAVVWEQLPQPLQVVYRKAVLTLEEVPLDPHRPSADQLRQWLTLDKQVIDLRQAPLLRLQVAKDDTGQIYGALKLHHIISDHESREVMLSEVAACLEGRAHELPPPVPYRNHVARTLAYARAGTAESFFRGKLAGIDEPTTPFGLLDVHGDGSTIAESRQKLDADLTARIRAQARRLGVSAAILFHAAWALVVAHTSAREDVVFGSLFSGRLQDGIGAQRALGMFINTLPVRLQLSGVTVADLVRQTQRELVDLLGHEHAPLALAQRCSQISGAAPLFGTLLNCLHSAPVTPMSGIEIIEEQEWSNYPITLSIDDLGDSFALKAQTDRRIDPQRINGYLDAATRALVDALHRAPRTPALTLSILPQGERREVLELFNATTRPYPTDKLTHELIEAHAARTPAAIAVKAHDESLTYAQLNERANQLARHLRAHGAGPDQRVALCIERGASMIIGLLGILKSGAAYVPLDPSYPAERLQNMIRDSAPVVLLTQEKLRPTLPNFGATTIALDSQWREIGLEPGGDLDARELGLHPSHLAYVIYTSGSTGTPKGVAVEHRNLVNLIHWHCDAFALRPGSNCSCMASLGFDAAGWEIWPSLSSGSTLALPPADLSGDAQGMLEWWAGQKVDVSFLPTPMAELAFSRDLCNRGLRTLLVGGDRLRLRPTSHTFELVNNYGPTESTVVATSDRILDEDTVVHIGRPIANTRIYILDCNRQPVPIGVAGEIYIAGAGVARGYLNRPEQTTERFSRDPFSADPSERMYRSGDLARWQANGTIEFLGRNDEQVKIRGLRIELGEIEAQLTLHPQVNEAAVMAWEDALGEKRLVAYVVCKTESRFQAPVTAEQLRAHLKTALPAYMVPSAFVMLDHLPLTPNGKLDRRALPAPAPDAYASRQYEPPQTELEEQLANIWGELLPVERIGRNDNFFELGGHSLLIVQMIERLRRLGLSTHARNVFDSPKLADLASRLTRGGVSHSEVPPNRIPTGCGSITPEMLPLVALQSEHVERIVRAVPGGAANIQDAYPLAPLQEGLLFHHLLNQSGGDAYARSMLILLSSRGKLDQLTHALQSVINRHDILRTAVLWDDLPQPVQVVYRAATLPVEEIVLDADLDPIEQLKERLSPDCQRLDLRHAPLMRLQVAKAPRGDHWYAILRTHHLVCDNASLDILVAEVVACLQGKQHTLPDPAPFRNHVAQTLARIESHSPEAFFRDKLRDVQEPTAPFGLLDVHGNGSQTETASGLLPPSVAEQLRSHARRLAVSVATLFHAAWALVVARTTGRDDIVFGTVLLGRLQGSAGAQRILGMFINTLPLRIRLTGLTARELILQMQRELADLLIHEQASLAVAQRWSGLSAGAPLFTSLVNYRHASAEAPARWSDAEGVALLASRGSSNYPILLSVDDLGAGFRLDVETDRRIDPRRVMAYFHEAAQSLVRALEETPTKSARSLSILPAHEQRQLVELFNATTTSFPKERLVQELFEEQAARTPYATAVLHEEHVLTYVELNERANRLARYLRAAGVSIGDYVPLVMTRSLQMLVAQLAVLKCGAVYVPVDPNMPATRQAFVIRDCRARFVLAEQGASQGLESLAVVWLDCAASTDEINRLPTENLALPTRASSLPAYVMYTSGSTGEPKGVLIPHRAISRLVLNTEYIQIEPTDRLSHCSNTAFDAATFEIWGALLNGAAVVIIPQNVLLDPDSLARTLHRHRVTIFWLTIGLFTQYVEKIAEAFGQFRFVLTGGDVLDPSSVRRVMGQSPPGHLLNAYGPTECTTFSTTYKVDPADGDTTRIPIGRPISNTRIYILDSHLQPVPVGARGEIYVAGDALALGYLNRPELTAERFIADPMAQDPVARMYRTGDLGRWRPDGTIDFLGRNDAQVKIRGYRIEPGEIEAQLTRHEHVNEALVLVRQDVPGEKRLVAYITPKYDTPQSSPNAPSLQIEELRAHLKAVLPDYMIPSSFVVLERLPLTINGKVDHRALPAPDLEASLNQEYEEPRGQVESLLAGIWQQVLRLPRVGRKDNFFQLGGHSILAMQVTVRLRSELSIEVPISLVFERQTLEDLAAAVDELCHARLLDDLTAGGDDIDELLATVGAMSETRVRELMLELTRRDRV